MDVEVDGEETYEFEDYDDPPLGYREPLWSHRVELEWKCLWNTRQSWYWWNRLKEHGRDFQNAYPADTRVWLDRRRVGDQMQIMVLKVECLGGFAAHVANQFHVLLRDLSRHGVVGGLVTTFRYADASSFPFWRVEDRVAYERMVQRLLEQDQERDAWARRQNDPGEGW